MIYAAGKEKQNVKEPLACGGQNVKEPLACGGQNRVRCGVRDTRSIYLIHAISMAQCSSHVPAVDKVVREDVCVALPAHHATLGQFKSTVRFVWLLTGAHYIKDRQTRCVLPCLHTGPTTPTFGGSIPCRSATNCEIQLCTGALTENSCSPMVGALTYIGSPMVGVLTYIGSPMVGALLSGMLQM